MMKRVPGCTRKPGQLLSVSNKGRGPTRRGIGRGAWHSTAADRIAAEQKADERADKADKKEEEEWRKAEQKADERADKADKKEEEEWREAEQKADERADTADKWMEEWGKEEKEEWRKAEQRADARAEKAAKQMYLIAVIYLIGWLVAPFLPGMVASVFPPS